MCNTKKSNTPTMYDGAQKIVVSCAILLLLAGNVVDPGRQSKTSQSPKINAGIEKTACNMFIIQRKVEPTYISNELLRGSINITAENPTNHATITISIVISCTK